MFADRDRPNHARVIRRREQDIAFLDRVRSASIEELRQMDVDFRRTSATWKKIAIGRMIKKAGGE